MIVNKEQLADIIGVTVATLTNWQKDGLPFAPKKGRQNAYDTANVINWMLDRERTRRAAVTASGDGIDLEFERARKERALADKYEYENATKLGELLEADDVRSAWERHIGNCRARLLSIPSKLAPVVILAENAREAQQLIKEQVTEALDELGGD